MASLLDEERDHLQEQHDSKSERWQESEKGQAFIAEIENLETLQGEIEDAKDTVDTIDLGEGPE